MFYLHILFEFKHPNKFHFAAFAGDPTWEGGVNGPRVGAVYLTGQSKWHGGWGGLP